MAWFVFSVWVAASLAWLPIAIGNIFVIPRTLRRMDALVLAEYEKNAALQRELYAQSR